MGCHRPLCSDLPRAQGLRVLPQVHPLGGPPPRRQRARRPQARSRDQVRRRSHGRSSISKKGLPNSSSSRHSLTRSSSCRTAPWSRSSTGSVLSGEKKKADRQRAVAQNKIDDLNERLEGARAADKPAIQKDLEADQARTREDPNRPASHGRGAAARIRSPSHQGDEHL